jgi:hypothetical protein
VAVEVTVRVVVSDSEVVGIELVDVSEVTVSVVAVVVFQVTLGEPPPPAPT